MSRSGKTLAANHQRIVIIGGGIIGLLTAYELVKSGAQVTIIDRQSIARESSWAGGGILSPLYPWRYAEAVTALASWSQTQYPSIMKELRDQTAIDPEYIKSGLLISSSNELVKAVKWAENHKINIELLSGKSTENLQKGLRYGADQWIWMPDVAQVRNPKLLQALRCYLDKNNVKFVENSAISDFIVESGSIYGLVSNNGNISLDKCLVAAGAWSGRLLSKLGIQIAVEPVKGQMLLLKGRPGLLARMVLKDSHYLIPRLDGRILVGSTLEHEGFDKSITESARDELVSAAEEIMPGILEVCEIEKQWAGLRPGSLEGIPYISEHPKVAGLFVSTGHFRNGFVLAPASARLAADLLLDRPPILDSSNYQSLGE